MPNRSANHGTMPTRNAWLNCTNPIMQVRDNHIDDAPFIGYPTMHITTWVLLVASAYGFRPGPSMSKSKSTLALRPREYLDPDNMKKLEQMFYQQNRRYSPYKRRSLQGEHNVSFPTAPTGPEESDPVEAWKKRIDDAVDRTPAASDASHDSNHEGGFLDALGVFRHKRREGGYGGRVAGSSPRGADKAGEFDTGSQFQIDKHPSYSFSDVGGYDNIKHELLQTADILTNFTKYERYNVRTPKGIIFEGPPGNGKTLLAKGFAGEINVSFVAVSGSEFSEKYVGVGASRIRELFHLAEEHKPCVIFIDEIDALARKRGNDMVSSNSEKDQTLNQLLINLDGYKGSNGVFVVGATNRIDLLDPALTRAGRMDKHIYIGNPDAATRRAIVQIHLQGKPVDPSVSIDDVVDMTAGFSGAQIENLLNESMLRALRENREIICSDDLEYIANRILAGWQAMEHHFSDDILDRIGIHEMGHAIVGYFCEDHAKLVKVCLNVWSPKTPGYTLFNATDQNANIYTKTGLVSHLMVLLSGRIAEEVFFGHSVTTGAKHDFEEAYRLAQNMIMQYGMGSQPIYPDSSDQSKYLIDQEVNALILDAQQRALTIINDAKALILDANAVLKSTHLLKVEQIDALIRDRYPHLLAAYLPTYTSSV